MPARLSALVPYPVKDFTYLATITQNTTFTAGGDRTLDQTITGTTGLVKDKDTSTRYRVQSSESSGSGTWTITDTLTFDFGKTIWNCLFYCLYEQGSATRKIQVSTNGTDWADLNANAQGSSTTAETYSALACRYFRFYAYSDNGTSPVRNDCSFYEIRISGSD